MFPNLLAYPCSVFPLLCSSNLKAGTLEISAFYQCKKLKAIHLCNFPLFQVFSSQYFQWILMGGHLACFPWNHMSTHISCTILAHLSTIHLTIRDTFTSLEVWLFRMLSTVCQSILVVCYCAWPVGHISMLMVNSPGKNLGSNTVSSITYTQVKHIASAGPSFSQLGPTFRIKGELLIPVIFDKFSNCAGVQLCRQAGRLQSFPMLLLASALIPPLDKVSITSHDVTSVQLVNGNVHMQSCVDQSPCEVEHRECGDPCFTEKFSCSRHAVEPRTGIEFPTVPDNILAPETNSNWPSEVNIQNLHGLLKIYHPKHLDLNCVSQQNIKFSLSYTEGSCWTGSRMIKVIKIKSQKVYAFGFYIHPSDVCKKLGPKYASIRAGELDKHHNFYRDLLREDISMTVRLVVSVNWMKISTVRNAFEKSLRARLMKTNPATDFDCLRKFSSLFSQDAPIRAGTPIYFRRTVDGHLITEIGGHQTGAVHSRDLCRAFFDMYIGEVRISEETKDEIGRNVASILRSC